MDKECEIQGSLIGEQNVELKMETGEFVSRSCLSSTLGKHMNPFNPPKGMSLKAG